MVIVTSKPCGSGIASTDSQHGPCLANRKPCRAPPSRNVSTVTASACTPERRKRGGTPASKIDNSSTPSPVGIGDVTTGLLAVPVAILLAAGGLEGRKAAVAWNVFGLLDFTVAVS